MDARRPAQHRQATAGERTHAALFIIAQAAEVGERCSVAVTDTELRLITAAAIIGEKSRPNMG